MAPVYASQSNWLDWTGLNDAPDNLDALIRSASAAVREATALWRYPVDPDTSTPADPDLASVFRDATCAQITALVTLDIDPAAGGALTDGFLSSTGIGSARMTYSGEAQVLAARQATAGGLCVEAQRILRAAGQMSFPTVFG